MIINVPQMPWDGDTELALEFPDSWDVTVCQMDGKDIPKISGEAIRTAFLNPIGTQRIAEIAKGKKSVVILFDDLARGTRTSELVPYVLEELKEGGIEDKDIRFISALGTHAIMRMMDYEKKLGLDIIQKYLVYNHNPYENCTYIGKTSRGTEISVNSEYMSCDLKIAICGVVPHPSAGFGGGGKIILPGICSYDTIYDNHSNFCRFDKDGNQIPDSWGNMENNLLRLDMEEAAKMSGLDVSVNAVMNLHRDTVALFVGDLVEAHREGVKMAQRVYATPMPAPADVVVANAYAKANEAPLTIECRRLLKEEGGDLIITCNTIEGQIPHYIARSFGNNIGGKLYAVRTTLPEKVKRMIVLGPYIDRVGLDWLGPIDSIEIINSWPEIIETLKKDHGNGTKVAVVPDATVQYFPEWLESK